MLRAGLLLIFLLLAHAASAQSPDALLAERFRDVPERVAPSGILVDRTLPFARIDELDGSAGAPAVGPRRWYQALHEVRGAADDPGQWPTAMDLRSRELQPGVFAIGLLDVAYDRIQPDRAAQPSLGDLHREDLAPGDLFAATVVQARSWRGRTVNFLLDPALILSNRAETPVRYHLDAGDGMGYRAFEPGQKIAVAYHATGAYILRLRAEYRDGTRRESAMPFEVLALAAPAPDDTLRVVAGVEYQGVAAAGDAWIYLADGHTQLTNPVLLIEGFDLDNSLNWDEIYDLLNAENLLEDIRAAGNDIVVLNFDDATDHIQRNALLVVELLLEIQGMIDPGQDFVLAGASMGALCSRYALGYMEQNALAHRARTLLSFDGPHGGANIPIGLQYWLDYFSGQSAEAEFLLSRLDRPAARQLLLYHYTDPPSATASADPLRAQFLADLAGVGDYPTQPRLVAIANGSGAQVDQGYAPGTQLISWEFYNGLVEIAGNVWAVGDGPATQVFEGLIDIIFLPPNSSNVTIAGSWPLDNAPGGYRNSIADADSAEAPYGDIVALWPAHCFVPTVSALHLPTEDPFFDIAGVTDLAALTPFDAVYSPAVNEAHVEVTAQNAAWIRQEVIETGTPNPAAPALVRHRLLPNRPNPFNPSTAVHFRLTETSAVRLEIFDARGRRVKTLLDEEREAGTWSVRWDGTDDTGDRVVSGVYHCRMVAGPVTESRPLVLVK